MLWRFASSSEAQFEEILVYTAMQHGLEAATHCKQLMIATFAELTISPMPPFSRAVNRLPGVRMIHLRHANRLVPVQAQVKEPRHLVVYRLTASDSVDILALVHDRMLVVRAARRALRTEGR